MRRGDPGLTRNDRRANRVTFGRVTAVNHLWQRFLLTTSLLVGLAVGAAATIFGYSNLNAVDIHFSVVRLRGIPLWAAVLVPVILTIAAGTLYHWLDSLHHFTEHMRHRSRVKELEAELGSLKARLDQVLEMPDVGAAPAKDGKKQLPLADADDAMAGLGSAEPLPATVPVEEPRPNGESTKARSRKKVTVPAIDSEPQPEPPTEPKAETEPDAPATSGA